MRISSPIKTWMAAAFGLVLVLWGAPAFAQEPIVITVDNPGDYNPATREPNWCEDTLPSDCTLRDAINITYWYNYYYGPYGESHGQYGYGPLSFVIKFAPAVFGEARTIRLDYGELTFPGPYTRIDGPGRQLTISGRGASRILSVWGESFGTITNLTLADGKATSSEWLPANGGAIYNVGSLVLIDVWITNSVAVKGGAIFTENPNSFGLSIQGGGMIGNRAEFGGAIANYASVGLTQVLLADNQATKAGGGIYNNNSYLRVFASELSGNQSENSGGGIYNDAGSSATIGYSLVARNRAASGSGGGAYNLNGWVAIGNSTFTLNEAQETGGAFASVGSSDMSGEVLQSTFVGNGADAGGAIYASPQTAVRLKNSIVAASGGGDCSGNITGDGYNLDTFDPAISMAGACPAADHVPFAALIVDGTPTDHGGPTKSLGIARDSVAVDRALDCTDYAGGLVTSDQTGHTRPVGAACDVGAFEYRLDDADGDGIGDDTDNCVSQPNPVQFDLDHDGLGNECDDDVDGDGVRNEHDASPESDVQCSDTDHDSCDDCASGTFNPAGDGPDNDGDGICNAGDNDVDTDGDGIQDLVDAFPYDRNACGDSDQDSCDDCAVLGSRDASNDGPDSDGDGVCNAGETDDDNDGVADAADNCPVTANADQADLNGNGLGDACDTALYSTIKAVAANLRNVSATGTFVSMADEYVTDNPIPLPFAFRFFGHEYSSLRISSNGFVTFADSAETGCCEGPDYPSADGPDNLIAGWWEDLSVPYAEGLTGQVRYQTLGVAPARQFVIGFYGVRHAHPTRDFTVTFEIILHEGGAIELQYGNIIDDGDGVAASAGFENADGRVGQAIGVGEQNLADFLANHGFLFTPAFPAAVLDSDGDGADDDTDACPADPAKTAPGACGCGAADSDPDGDGAASCNDPDDDNDGIADALDRNKTTGADESTVASSDYRKDAATFGSVTRNGWTVALVDGANGITATISGAGSSPALISACDGRVKQIVLNAANEAARWHCEGSSIVVDAIAASPRIEVEKQYCVGSKCGWTVFGKLWAGQHLKTGSPWTNGAPGAVPVTIVDPNGAEAGSFTLDANESVDVELMEGPNGDPNAQVTVLAGSVTVSAFGQSETLNESSGTITFGADTEVPVITCAMPDGAWHSDNVSLACTAGDAGSGLANPADASFSLSTSVPAGTQDANAFTGSRTVCDAAGNCATQPAIGGNKIDRRTLSMTCGTDAPPLWPANHKMAAINVSVTINGVVSTSGFTLKSVTSSEPDNGLGDGDTAGDIQGWTIGSADVSGQLRAERGGKGAGRTYTLTYEGRTAAGATASCTATVVVPQNGSKK